MATSLRVVSIRLTGLFVSLIGVWVAYNQSQPEAPRPAPVMTLTKIKGDLYEIEGGGGNVAVYVTNDGVLIVDAKNYGAQFYEALMKQIRTITDKPVKYLLNTHYHADHIGGDEYFAPTAQIVQHANARLNIVNRVETRKPPAAQPPQGTPANVTFEQSVSIHMGGKEVKALYFGRGHTNGDAVIYFPAEKTIHSGDMVTRSGKTYGPMVDYEGGGSIVELTKTLTKVHDQVDFDTLIPGHGPVIDKPGLVTYIHGLEAFRSRAKGLIHSGKSEEEVGKVLADEYLWTTSTNNLNFWWTLRGLMKELK